MSPLTSINARTNLAGITAYVGLVSHWQTEQCGNGVLAYVSVFVVRRSTRCNNTHDNVCRAGRRARTRKKMAEPLGWLRRDADWNYAAFVFLVAFLAGFSVAGFVALALSLAANSCFTLAVIAATSTL